MATEDDFTRCIGCGTWFVKGFDPNRTLCPECKRRAQLGDFTTNAEGEEAISQVTEKRDAQVKALEEAKTPGELFVAYHAATRLPGMDAFGMPLSDVYRQEQEAMMRDLGMDQKTFMAASRREGLLIQIGPSALCLVELVNVIKQQKSTVGFARLIQDVSSLKHPFGREVEIVARAQQSKIPWLYRHNSPRLTLRADDREIIRVSVPGQPSHAFPIDGGDPEGEAKRLLMHVIEVLRGQRPGVR